MKADDVGKLDGLRDIIHPPVPVTYDYTILMVLGMLFLITGLFYYLYRRYQQRRLYKARQRYIQLRKNQHRWTAHQSGEAIIGILRLYTGTHNMKYQHSYGMDDKEWTALLKRCNQLRFSDVVLSEDLLTMPMALLEYLLWQRR